MELINQTLPTYVANCFAATGFNDIESIREMDITNGPKNCIEIFKDYINTRKSELPSCMGPNDHYSLPFEFPPGHRIRIVKFIQEVQS